MKEKKIKMWGEKIWNHKNLAQFPNLLNIRGNNLLRFQHFKKNLKNSKNHLFTSKLDITI
jgi:hypothetical protein